MFYIINLDVRQLRQVNNNASIVKRAKERFCNSETLKKSGARGQIGTSRLSKEFDSVNKLFLSAYHPALS